MNNAVSRVNITRVLRTIWLQPGISRVDISKYLGLNKSTISKIVAELERLGIVQTLAVGDAGPTGGRRPVHLRINPNWGCVMGVEIQTEAFTVIGVDLHGTIFFAHTEPFDLRTTTLVDAFCTIVRRFRPNLERTGRPLIGIGVGLPGIIDPLRGVVRASLPLDIHSPIPFVEQVRKNLRTDLTIMIDNDANCCCYGELAVRHSDRPENFLFVLGEQRKHTVQMDDFRIMALGLGLFLNGQVHHGAGFSAGEFRSIMYKPGQINQFSLPDDKAVLFLQDPRINTSIIQELSMHIAFLVNTLNLSKVIVGGPIETLAEELTTTLQRTIQANWAYPGTVECPVALSRLGENAVAFGSAGMILEHLIAIPEVSTEEGARPALGMDLISTLIGRAEQDMRA